MWELLCWRGSGGCVAGRVVFSGRAKDRPAEVSVLFCGCLIKGIEF